MGGGSVSQADDMRAIRDDERRRASENATADRAVRDKEARKRRIAARDRAKAGKPKVVTRVEA